MYVPLTTTVHDGTHVPLFLNPFSPRLSEKSGVDLSSMYGAITDVNTSSTDTVGGGRNRTKLGRTQSVIIVGQDLRA